MSKKLGGSTFVYNAIRQDYCIIESLECLYELCDEVSIAYGGDDGTIELINNWARGRKGIILIPFTQDQWHEQKGREKLSYFSNLAIAALDTELVYYQQADEVTHEASFPFVRQAIAEPVEAFLVTRINLWHSPYTMLNVPQERKPCSTEVIRLAKVRNRCVNDAESLGVAYCVDNYLKDIRIYHMGFVRSKVKHLEKIRHIQDDVFLIDHDKRIDSMTEFDSYAFFSQDDVIPIPEPLPKFITQWAKARE